MVCYKDRKKIALLLSIDREKELSSHTNLHLFVKGTMPDNSKTHPKCNEFVREQVIHHEAPVKPYIKADSWNSQDYWVSGLYLSPGLLKDTTFRNLDVFRPQLGGGRGDTYFVESIRKS
jgi:hypothetical protein